MPRPEERARLWRQAGTPAVESDRAATNFRQGTGRIAEAAARARIAAAWVGRTVPDWRDVTEGVARGAATLDTLARRGVGEVNDDALVLPPALRDSLNRLLMCARASASGSRRDSGLPWRRATGRVCARCSSANRAPARRWRRTGWPRAWACRCIRIDPRR